MKETWQLYGMKSPEEIFADLVEHLSWKAGASLLFEATRAHLLWTQARLRILDKGSNRDLYRRVKSLPAPSQKRVLTAPLFFSLLLEEQDSGAAIEKIEHSIAVEEYLCGKAKTTTVRGWSALGDVQLISAAAEGIQIRDAALRVENLVIDTRSPLEDGVTENELGKIEAFSESELREFQRRVREARNAILDISPIALETLDECVRQVSSIRTSEDTSLTKSSSMNLFLGRMLLTNGASEAWSSSKLIDRVVHESIHSLLYKFELVAPLYTDYQAAVEEKIQSPWSGRTLSLRSFVHACFVWFGLKCFWEMDMLHRGDIHLREAQQGFAVTNPLETLGAEARQLVQPYVWNAIASIYHRVDIEKDAIRPNA